MWVSTRSNHATRKQRRNQYGTSTAQTAVGGVNKASLNKAERKAAKRLRVAARRAMKDASP